MNEPLTIDVKVAYARPEEQVIVTLTVPVGTTVQQAIQLSGLLTRYAEINLAENKVGVYGEVRSLAHPLQPHDRVEIYRPLLADAKSLRRRRARQQESSVRGTGY